MEKVEIYRAAKKAGKLACGTIKAAEEIHNRRVEAKKINNPPKPERIIMPLGAEDVSSQEEKIKSENKAKKNWEGTYPGIIKADCELKYVNNGTYSRRCTYTYYTYRVLVQSYGYIFCKNGKRVLRIRFAGKKYDVKPLRGWSWGIDSNGVKLYKNSNPDIDYHVDQTDVLDLPATAKKAIENFKTRKLMEKTNKIAKKLPIKDVMVCAVDSIRAGNCRVGTENFAKAHNIKLDRHIPATVLEKIDTTSKDRVQKAINFAKIRQAKEIAQGFSVLKNHYYQV